MCVCTAWVRNAERERCIEVLPACRISTNVGGQEGRGWYNNYFNSLRIPNLHYILTGKAISSSAQFIFIVLFCVCILIPHTYNLFWCRSCFFARAKVVWPQSYAKFFRRVPKRKIDFKFWCGIYFRAICTTLISPQFQVPNSKSPIPSSEF